MIKKSLLIFALLYFFGIAAIWLDGATTGYEKSEYAVMLGNQVYPSGEPSERLEARLERAAELFRNGTVQKIIVSGGLGKEGHDEAAVMKRYLETQGIPAVAVIADSYGNNTHLTARNAKQWANTAKPIIVISQLYHLSRTKMAFGHVGFTQVGAAYPQYFEWRDVYASLRELPAWFSYWLSPTEPESTSKSEYISKPECKDFLKEIGWRIEGVEYQSCDLETRVQTRAMVAKYHVAGKHAAAAEQFFRDRTKMPAMRFACCGWEVPGALTFGVDIPGTAYAVYMMSGEETGIDDRAHWDQISHFEIHIRHLFWSDI